jgi:hypothetical protein
MLKLDGLESPMLSMHDLPLPAPAPNVYTTPLATGTPTTNSLPPAEHHNHIKPSPPTEFNGDHTKAHTFWNSVELYICLAPHQFESEYVMIMWVFSFMKSGHVVLFVNCILRHETCMGTLRFRSFTGLKLGVIENIPLS